MFEQNPRGWSPAEWGLRWLWDQPEVTCVLSGMNSIEMVEENCRAASESSANMLTDEDRLFIQAVKEAINGTSKVSCTGCGYCMPCPAGIDIPNTFRAYNVMFTESKRAGRMDYLRCTAFSRSTKSVSQCIDCGRCESRCPQQIKIREELKKASRELETIGYKVIKKGVDILKLW